MESQPSGNDSELLFIETEEVYFSIKGNKETIGCGELKSLTIMVEGKEYVEDINQYLYFKEYTNYELVIERKKKTTIEFYHENPIVLNLIDTYRFIIAEDLENKKRTHVRINSAIMEIIIV